MLQYGAASVYGVDGVITQGAAIAAIPDSMELDHSAQIEDFMSGINQLLGFYKTNERIGLTIVLLPKADTIAHAKAALALPVGPCKVTISGMPLDDGSDIRHINGDYIYKDGATRSHVRGQNALRLPIFRPLDIPDSYKIGGAFTTVSVTNFITALVTPMA